MASKGQELKALINAPEIVITPGVYDGFSARLDRARRIQDSDDIGRGDF